MGLAEFPDGAFRHAEAGDQLVAFLAPWSSRAARGARRRWMDRRRIFPRESERVSLSPRRAALPMTGARRILNTLLEHPQTRQQIAAVNGRNIARVQRLESFSVVPVEQMAFVAFEPMQGLRGSG